MAAETGKHLKQFTPRLLSRPEEDFQDYVSKELISLSVTPLFKMPFSGQAGGVQGVQGTKFAHLSGSPQSANRTTRHSNEAPCEFVGFNFLEQGQGLFRQGNRSVRVQAGQGVLYDADRSYTYSFEGRFRQSVILVPQHLLEPSDIPGFPKIFSFDRAGTNGHALLREIRNALTKQEEVSAAERNAEELYAGLMNLGSRTLASYRLQALDLIHAAFTEKELNGQMIATALGVSERHLRRAFAQEEGGVGRAILRIRLEAAAAVLASIEGTLLSISDVADRCGFRSLSFFSREFKKWQGVAPREFRNGHTALAA